MKYTTLKTDRVQHMKDPTLANVAEVIDCPITDGELRQAYYSAVLDHADEMGGMQTGIYVWWDLCGTIVDVAVVNPTGASASTSIVERFQSDLRVAPFHYGDGQDVTVWEEMRTVMDEFPSQVREWVQGMTVTE